MAPNAKRPRTDSKETRRSAKRRAEEEAEEDQFVHSASPEAVTILDDSQEDDKVSPQTKDEDSEDEEREERAKARESHLKKGSNNTLFIRSIPYDVTPDELTTHFSFVAPVKHAHIVLDPVTKKSRGFGFVTFAEDEDAKTAVQEFNGKEFKGRALKVEIAEARHRAGHDFGDGERGEVKPKPGKEEIEKRNPRLIVRNLSWNIRKPEQLSEVFKKYGKVLDVIIPPKKGAPKGSALLAGFAFVTMKRHRHAQKAIEEVNGMSISGRNVAVDWAVEKDKWEKVKEEGGELDMEMVGDESDSSGDEDFPQIKEEEADKDGIDEHVDETEDKSEDEVDDDENYDSMEDDDDDEDEDDEDDEPLKHDNSLSLFLRNVPFSVDEQSLHAHFTENFGPVRYARIVMDRETERPRGTAFIAFYNEEHYKDCLRNAPKPPPPGTKSSLLFSESQDLEGKYTIDGRALIVTKAIGKDEAGKLAVKNSSVREAALGDKRRLYLLSEGNIPSNTPMYQKLSSSERALREASIKQRKLLIQNNPSLHLSLTRLSIRNLPRSITAKDLKFLAREAVVGFAVEVKAEKRQPLSKEELSRGGDQEKEAEAERRRKGKGVVRQVKIIEEKTGAGGGSRSRGYGFIEYVSHRWALMGLRWLNGREVGGGLELPVADIVGRREKMAEREKAPSAAASAKGKLGKGGKVNNTKLLELPVNPSLPQERKKRLIVEFALENAQVVHRRKETEKKWREIAKERKAKEATGGSGTGGKGGKGKGGRDGKHGKELRTEKRELKKGGKSEAANGTGAGSKRKRGDDDKTDGRAGKKGPRTEEDSKRAAANRHIARKRQMKKAGK
ncbi:ribosome biogenesis protein Nop4 [Tirmania nivea]|nr:ribosome biogenesis protein Nop4 [Tirmania nivea]